MQDSGDLGNDLKVVPVTKRPKPAWALGKNQDGALVPVALEGCRIQGADSEAAKLKEPTFTRTFNTRVDDDFDDFEPSLNEGGGMTCKIEAPKKI